MPLDDLMAALPASRSAADSLQERAAARGARGRRRGAWLHDGRNDGALPLKTLLITTLLASRYVRGDLDQRNAAFWARRASRRGCFLFVSLPLRCFLAHGNDGSGRFHRRRFFFAWAKQRQTLFTQGHR